VLALVILEQLVIGEAALVRARALLMEFRFRTLAACLLLRHASPLLGRLGLARARFGLTAVLFRHGLAPLLKLPLTPPHTGALAHSWQQQSYEGYQDDRAYDNDDDGSG
jgi:hypothetical protein